MRFAGIACAIVTVGALTGGVPDRFPRAEDHAWQEQDHAWQEQDYAWQEIAWPFPRDGWPTGRALRCTDASCPGTIEIYVRPKLGFCNCDTGVADDDEVDRVTDLDLISAEFEPRAAGKAVRVMDLGGRMRAYQLTLPDRSARTGVAIALSQRCDLLVVAAQGTAEPAELERAVLHFLHSNALGGWIMAAMAGR